MSSQLNRSVGIRVSTRGLSGSVVAGADGEGAEMKCSETDIATIEFVLQ